MKKVVEWLAVATLLGAAGSASGQDFDAAVAIAETEAGRVEIISALMEFEPGQADEFWPVYREYRGEMVELAEMTGRLIEDFAKIYPGEIPGDQAKSIMDNWLKGQRDAARIKTKYSKRFRKVLGDSKALTLMQIDNKLNAAVAFNVANAVPLMR